MVCEALQSPTAIPIVQLHSQLKDGGYKILAQHILNLRSIATKEPIEDQNLPATIDNWVRLGLVQVTYNEHLTDPNKYSWVEQRPEIVRLKQVPQENEATVEYQKGLLERTELGKRFSKAIGLL